MSALRLTTEDIARASRERALRESAHCPECEWLVAPENWHAHFEIHHAGLSVPTFPKRETFQQIDTETGEILDSRPTHQAGKAHHPGELVIDPEIRDFIPPQSTDERQRLEASLLEEGCRDALVVWKGHQVLVDGHHRYEICRRHGIPFDVIEMDFDCREAIFVWMILNQLARRNAPDAVRIELALKLEPAEAALAKQRQLANLKHQSVVVAISPQRSNDDAPTRTRDKLAGAAGVGSKKFDQGKHILNTAPETLKQQWRNEEVSTNAAYKLTRALEESPAEHRERILQLAGDNDEKVRILNRLYKSMGSPETNGTFDEIIRTGGFAYGKEMDKWCDFSKASVEEIQRALRSIADNHAAINVGADEETRRKNALKTFNTSENNEWYTPAEYIAAVHELLGAIDLDPATCAYANQTVQAEHIYTLDDDGLTQAWHGRVFLNPPYGYVEGTRESNQNLWSAKLVSEYCAGQVSEAVLLINAVTDRTWFQPFWDYLICFARQRIAFYGPDGKAGAMTVGSALVYFGTQRERFAEVFSQFGPVVTGVYRR